MKLKPSFETRVLAVIILIIFAVSAVGFFAYRTMSSMITAITLQASPNEKILLLKGITSDLDEAQKSARTFSLNKNSNYLDSFSISKANAYIKLKQLIKITDSNKHQKRLTDSLNNLITERFAVLEQIEHSPQKYSGRSLDKVYKNIINENTQPKEELQNNQKKKSLLKRIFSQPEKKHKAQANANVTKVELEQELQAVKKEQSDYEQHNLNKQLTLIQKDDAIMDHIRILIKDLENAEAIAMIGRSAESQKITKRANATIIIIISVISLLLLALAFSIYRYIEKGRVYNDALQKAKDETDVLYKAKQNFFTRMSHELRTPISAILGFTDQVLNSTITKEQQLQLSIVKKSGEHLLMITNEILDLSKLEAGKLKVEQLSFEPAEVIKEVFVMMQNEADKKHLNYTLSDDNTMPQYVLGDAMRLKQILLNIIGNAIKFTEKGTVNLTVTHTKQNLKNIILNIKINDTGIGIPQDRIARVFNEFEQADERTTLKFGGTGLGLNISKKLLDLLNGKIELSSENGKGTTVIIELPLIIDDKAKRAIVAQLPEPETNVHELKGKSVLIVDDNEYNQLLFLTILKSAEMICGQAVNGKLAIDMLEQNNYDVILMDLIMPEMNGIEATIYIRQQLKGEKSKVPIIALTALGSEDIIKRANEAGVDDILNKPFKKQDLFMKISALLKTSDRQISAPSNTGHIAPPLDPEKHPMPFNLQDLYRTAGSNVNFVHDMVEIFIRTTKEGMERVKYYAGRKDWENLANAAHKISSPCKHIEAKQLLCLIKKIEEDARGMQNLQHIETLVAQLDKKATELIALLEIEIAK